MNPLEMRASSKGKRSKNGGDEEEEAGGKRPYLARNDFLPYFFSSFLFGSIQPKRYRK